MPTVSYNFLDKPTAPLTRLENSEESQSILYYILETLKYLTFLEFLNDS